MPAKKQDRYHHGDLRRTLLDAALHIVERSGAGALSLRELARRAGVSHAAPYRHFESREALLIALAIDGFRRLGATMEACAGDERDPLRRFRSLGLGYVLHAVGHPGYFKVMFSTDLRESGETPELRAAGEPTLRALVECIAEAQAAGQMRPGDPRALAVSAWSMVHGLSMLLVDQQIYALTEPVVNTEPEAHAVIDVVIRGLAPDAPAGRIVRRRRRE